MSNPKFPIQSIASASPSDVDKLTSDVQSVMRLTSTPVPTQIITKDYQAKVIDQRIAHISDIAHTVTIPTAYDARNRRYLWINAGAGALTVAGQFYGAKVDASGVMTNPVLKKGEGIEFFSYFVPNQGTSDAPDDLQIDGVKSLIKGAYKFQIVNFYTAKLAPDFIASEIARVEALAVAAQTSANNAAATANTASASITAHLSRTDNPHGTTKTQIGLGNVNDTSDIDKPISTLQKTYVDQKITDLIGGAPAALDTLKEIADKLNSEDSAISALTTTIAGKEPVITTGTTLQYFRGDKTWRDLATDVRGALLTGISFATNSAVVAADSLLVALGKLQSQINNQKSTFGIASVTLPVLALNATYDVAVTFTQALAGTTYTAKYVAVNPSGITLANFTFTEKSRTASSITYTIKNTGIAITGGTLTLIVLAQGA